MRNRVGESTPLAARPSAPFYADFAFIGLLEAVALIRAPGRSDVVSLCIFLFTGLPICVQLIRKKEQAIGWDKRFEIIVFYAKCSLLAAIFE